MKNGTALLCSVLLLMIFICNGAIAVIYSNTGISLSTEEDNQTLALTNSFTDTISTDKSVSLQAYLESGGEAGEIMVVKVTIKNIGEATTNYSVNITGYESWADSANLDKKIFIIQPWDSEEATITFDVKEEALGDNIFDIDIFSDGKLVVSQPIQVDIGPISNDTESRISALERWENVLYKMILSIQTSLQGLTDKINFQQTKIDSHETRITALENKNSTIINNTIFVNSSNLAYFKYLSYTDRKNIICGYGKDNHLNKLIDLNVNCTITYKKYSTREIATCICKEIK